MKSLKQIREEINITEVEDKKLTTLIRAGLFDIHKLPLLKRALSKDNTKMSPTERNSLLDLLDTLIAHVTGDAAVFNKVRGNVMREDLDEAYEVAGDLPMVLILKRRSVRAFPDGQRVALYWADKLKTFISVPYSAVGVGYSDGVSVAEEIELTEVSREKLDNYQHSAGDDYQRAQSNNQDDRNPATMRKRKKGLELARLKMSRRKNKVKVKATEEVKENIDTIFEVVNENSSKLLTFQDGTEYTCGAFTASAITEVYNAVNDVNKEKMKASLNESKVAFMKMAEFALSKV